MPDRFSYRSRPSAAAMDWAIEFFSATQTHVSIEETEGGFEGLPSQMERTTRRTQKRRMTGMMQRRACVTRSCLIERTQALPDGGGMSTTVSTGPGVGEETWLVDAGWTVGVEAK